MIKNDLKIAEPLTIYTSFSATNDVEFNINDIININGKRYKITTKKQSCYSNVTDYEVEQIENE